MSAPDFFATEAARFERAVRRSFGFLVEDFGFDPPRFAEADAAHWKDRRAILRYLGRAGVGVEAALVFADPDVGVSLVSLVEGVFPERYSYYGDSGAAVAVNLDSLVEWVTDGAVRPMLPQWDAESSEQAVGEAMDARKAMIVDAMEAVVDDLAAKLRRYGAVALRGDVSEFPEIAAYHRQKHWGR